MHLAYVSVLSICVASSLPGSVFALTLSNPPLPWPVVLLFFSHNTKQTGRFNFLRLNFYDHRSEDCAWFIYSAFDFIKAAEEQRGRVLVHCVQGVSR